MSAPSPEERELDARNAPPRPKSFTSTRFFKVILVLVLLIVASAVWGWYSQTPDGSLQTSRLSADWNGWTSSLAPPVPTVHSGLIHPATGPGQSVYFFTTSTPQTSQYAMEQGDTMFGDNLLVYGFTPLASNTTRLTFTSYSPVQIVVHDPKTNASILETRYTIRNSTTSVSFPPHASFAPVNVTLPVTSQTQLVNVSIGSVSVFYFYHHTFPSYLAAPPSTQGALFSETEDYVIGSLVVAAIALVAASATAKRTGYIPSMGRWGWVGAMVLLMGGFGVFYEYQAALTLASVPYTLLPSFVGFYFVSLQVVRPPTYPWLFESIDTSALTPSKYLRQIDIIPSSVDEGEPRVARDSWSEFIRGKHLLLRFVKEEKELAPEEDSFEGERVLLQNEYWYFDVSNSPGYRVFIVKEPLRLLEDEDESFYRVVLASPHMKDVEEFTSDLRTVETISAQKHELTVRNRYLRNNVISSANVIASRVISRLMGTTPSRRILNTSEFVEAIESGKSRKDLVRDAGAEKGETVGKEGTATQAEGDYG